MAVQIQKGGWILIFALGAGIVGYALDRYGIVDFGGMFSKGKSSRGGETVDTSKPLPNLANDSATNAVRVRVNIWVGCVGGLVANGGLDTAPGSIYTQKGLKVSFKIIDDWTEGAAALATNSVDVMLTTTDVWAKDYAQFKARGFSARAFLLV